MKKFIYLIVLLLISEITFSQATTNIPQYTLQAKNFNFVTPEKLVFDLVFTHTDAIPLQLAGWQFFFRAPQTFGTFLPGFGSASAFMLDSNAGVPASDLPETFRPRSGNVVIASNSPGNYEFRLAANSLPGCGNGLMIAQGVPVLIGRFQMRSTTPINISVLNDNPFIIRDSCESPLSVTRTKINCYNENCFNQEITRCASHSVNLSGILPKIEINIKLAIEGLYNPVSDVSLRKDTVTVYLRNVNSPYLIIDSSKSMIDSISHTGNFVFFNRPVGTYYFSVKNRKILETWSQLGGTYFIHGINNYDFTSAASKAYGNNMVLIGSRYCIYTGNFNNDMIIDADDLSLLENDLYNYQTGDALTNVNGDNIVDIDDLAIVDRNAENLITVERPGMSFLNRQFSFNKYSIKGDNK